MKRYLLIFAVMLLAATTAQAGDPYCEGMAKADRLGCIASKYDNYATCVVQRTFDEDVDGVGCCTEDYYACRADAYQDYLACRADVDTCTE
jgi:hypothetical protein